MKRPAGSFPILCAWAFALALSSCSCPPSRDAGKGGVPASSRPAPGAPASRPAGPPSFHGRSLAQWAKAFLEEEDYGARVQASEALAALGAPAVPTLAQALRDPELRFLAGRALEKIGRPAVAGLVPVLSDPDEETRIAAVGVLGGIGPQAKEAVGALMERVRKGSPLERWAALEALGNIGPAASAALPLVLSILEQRKGPPLTAAQKIRALKVLEGLLRDENELVRRTAASVLERIRRGGKAGEKARKGGKR